MKQNILSWIKKNAEKLGLKDSYSCKDISSGESNTVFLVLGSKKVIVRANKSSLNSSIAKEAKILTFLEKHHVRAPRLLLYAPQSELISAQEYVGTKDLDTKSMTPDQMNSLADLFAALHSIPVQEYNAYFQENHKTTMRLYDLYKLLASGGKSDFEKVKSHHKEELQIIIGKQTKHIESYKDDKSTVPLSLIHKDSHGKNLRVKESTVYLIDWEDAGIHYGLCDVVQFLGFSELPAHLHAYIKKRYEQKMKFKIDSQIFDTILYSMLVHALCWNARKMDESPQSKKYVSNYEMYSQKLQEVAKRIGL